MNQEYFNTLNHIGDSGTLINNSEINELVCSIKHSVFTKHRGNHKIFVETGTYLGCGIANAFATNFEEMYSIELIEEHYIYAKNRWKDKSNVHIYLGTGSSKLEEFLFEINEPVFFWLDAHDAFSGSPTYKELEVIKRHPIKTHTILIDDIPILFNKNHIEFTVLDINTDYQITYEPTGHGKDGILVAKI